MSIIAKKILYHYLQVYVHLGQFVGEKSVFLNDTGNLECRNIKKIFSSCLSDIKLSLIRCEGNYNWEPSIIWHLKDRN